MAPLALAFFNNKGGTGKTTLSCNMAATIAKVHGLRVAYIDGDPQCNATQLLLEDDFWSEIFSNRARSVERTILKALTNIRAGDSSVDHDVELHRSTRFGVDVLAGHPGLSVVEDLLSTSWLEFKGGTIGGARRSLWVRNLIAELDYDLVVMDMGPSLGALNRSFLLGADRFVTPMAADLFSLYALDNIADWMRAWLREYESGLDAIEANSADILETYSISTVPAVANGYSGYTVQQYVSRTSKSQIRHVKAYEQHKAKIPDRAKSLAKWSDLDDKELNIGVVPNMFSMVPLAQAAHAPIRDLRPQDGLRGAQVSQNANYAEQLDMLADRLMDNLPLEQRDG